MEETNEEYGTGVYRGYTGVHTGVQYFSSDHQGKKGEGRGKGMERHKNTRHMLLPDMKHYTLKTCLGSCNFKNHLIFSGNISICNILLLSFQVMKCMLIPHVSPSTQSVSITSFIHAPYFCCQHWQYLTLQLRIYLNNCDIAKWKMINYNAGNSHFPFSCHFPITLVINGEVLINNLIFWGIYEMDFYQLK